MIDESLRIRLESLNRGPLPTVDHVLVHRLNLQRSTKSSAASPLRPGTVKPIPGLLRRGEVVTNDAGEHWRVCIPSRNSGPPANDWSRSGAKS